MPALSRDPERELLEFMAGECSLDPELFMEHAYPWGKAGTELHDSPGPRTWQRKVARFIANRLKDPAKRFRPIRIAVASGHGIGKSAEISMLADWGLSTCEDCKIVLTANTERQLRTKTMPEVAKWRRMSITTHWFDTTATAIRSLDPRHADTWRLDAVPWSEHNPVAFQGLHAKGKRIIVLMDEGSEIPRVIWEATEGALTDENTEIIWIVFANPTSNTGNFPECFTGPQRHLWATLNIDSRTVEGTNKAQLQEWVDTYGEDSDFVRVRVRGVFPNAGDRQLIPSDVVEAAAVRQVEVDNGAPVIVGVDVARFGSAQSVICVRHGRDCRSFPLRKFRGMAANNLAGEIIQVCNQVQPDAVFVDGGGVGGPLIDFLKLSGYGKIIREVQAASTKVTYPNRYVNKRAEMWGEMAEWLKVGAIAKDRELMDDLKAPERIWRGERLLVESKEDMETRGIASPDTGDALAHTFAGPVARRDMAFLNKFETGGQVARGVDFDVFA